MVRIGIIGVGHMGGYHATICKDLAHATLAGIADPNQANWTKVNATTIFATQNFSELLAHVDAVIIATPTRHHHAIAKACLLAGKHVLIEKPITKNYEEALELFDLATQHNLTLHVGHVERFNGAICEAKELIANPLLIETHRVGPFSSRPIDDSVVIDLMIHDIDLVLGMVSSHVESLQVIGHKIKTSLNDIAIVQIKFASGTLANLVASRASHTRKRSFVVHQADSFLQLDLGAQEMWIAHHAPDTLVPATRIINSQNMLHQLAIPKENALKKEIEYFIDAILNVRNQRNAKHDLAALSIALAVEQKLHSTP